jgi:hypothetical protein
MRVYRVTVGDWSRYAGTQAEATKLKQKLNELAGLPKPAHTGAEVFEIDVPTSKGELLAWINALARRGGPQGGLT